MSDDVTSDEALKHQIDRLADYIMRYHPDEPGRLGQSEGAVEVAIRIMGEQAARLHAADVWAHMHATVDHACGECRALLMAIYPEKHGKKMDYHLAAVRARLAPDKRRAEWSATARKMMATVLPGDIDVLLAALTDIEAERDEYKAQSETHLERWVEQTRNAREERGKRIAAETRLNAALELDQYGGSHTYACKHGAGGGGCHQECARLRKVMLGGDV